MIPHTLLVNVMRHIACVVDIGRMANVSRSFLEAMFDPYTWIGRTLCITHERPCPSTLQCKLQRAMICCMQVYELDHSRHQRSALWREGTICVEQYFSAGYVPNDCFFLVLHQPTLL